MNAAPEATTVSSTPALWIGLIAADPAQRTHWLQGALSGLNAASRDASTPAELAWSIECQEASSLLADAVQAPAAEVLLVSGDAAQLAAVEARHRRSLDVRLDAADPRSLRQLIQALHAQRDFDRAGRYGAAAGALEIGAGSLVHGLQLPFGGLSMACMQASLLTRAAEGLSERGRVVWVALIAAGLKSMSPAGRRVRPMVAIAMQGWLYALSLRALGWHAGSVALGGALIGLWAAAQGLLLQWLLLGDALNTALQVLVDEAREWISLRLSVAALIGLWLGGYALVGAVAGLAAWRRRHQPQAPPALKLPMGTPPRVWRHSLAAAFAELRRPSLWLPIALVLAALAWAGQPAESLVFLALRALSVAFVLLVLLQRVDWVGVGDFWRRRGRYGPALAWHRAMQALRGPDGRDG